MRTDRRTFCKQLGWTTAGLGLISCLPQSLAAAPFRGLPRSAPQAQGVDATGILAFLEALEKSQHEFHSFMMVRHGHVVAEGWWAPYAAKLNHTMYSMSKSFTSTAVGFAVSEGKLSVEDPVISFFPKDLPATVSENLAALRVKHLLSMSVGHAQDSTLGIVLQDNWVKAFLACPVANKPGSTFLYDSGASYMLSAIVQKVTGHTVFDYLTPRLFAPLDIRGATWGTSPQGINPGGWGLNIQTEGLAKFGQLYLQKGVWQGKQILPAAWIEEATSKKIQQQPESPDIDHLKKTSDWHQGYCYQFWRARHNAFRGDGAFGQYTIVLPEKDAVIAITSETVNMQGELDLVWEHLLPAMSSGVLPPSPEAQKQLTTKLGSLALLSPKGLASSPALASRISGKRFQIENSQGPVQAVSFKFNGSACVFTIEGGAGTYSITCGLDQWARGETGLPGCPAMLIPSTWAKNQPKSRIAAGGRWKDESTFEMTWRFLDTPHHETLTCHFEGDRMALDWVTSVTHREKFPALRGQMIG